MGGLLPRGYAADAVQRCAGVRVPRSPPAAPARHERRGLGRQEGSGGWGVADRAHATNDDESCNDGQRPQLRRGTSRRDGLRSCAMRVSSCAKWASW